MLPSFSRLLLGFTLCHALGAPHAYGQASEPSPRTVATAAQVQADLHALELRELELRTAKLRAADRSLLGPGLVVGTGLSSMFIGAAVFASAWSGDYDDDDYSRSKDITGLVMLPVGALLTLVGTPLFAVRASRRLRLARCERRLSEMHGSLQLAPALTPTSAVLSLRLAL